MDMYKEVVLLKFYKLDRLFTVISKRVRIKTHTYMKKKSRSDLSAQLICIQTNKSVAAANICDMYLFSNLKIIIMINSPI
jgi:hypothetical protein